MRNVTRNLLTLAVAMALLTVGTYPVMAEAHAGHSSVAGTLENVPDKAAIIVMVPDVGGLSKKISDLNKSLGLNLTHLQNPLAAVEKKTGLKGIDPDGAFVAVISDLPLPDENGNVPNREPSLALLIPVKNYQTFVEGFGGKAGEKITRLNLPSNEQGFAKKMGNFAVMSPKEDMVRDYSAGSSNAKALLAKKLSKLTRTQLDQSDALVIVNFQAFAEKARPVVAQAVKAQAGMIEHQFGKGPQGDMAKAWINFMGSLGDAALRDANALVLGMSLDDKGIALSYGADFKPGSEAAKLFKGGGNAAAVLDRLPNRDYIFASAVDLEGIDTATMIKGIKGVFDGMKGDGKNFMLDMMGSSLDMLEGVDSFSQVIYPSQGGMMMGNLFQSVNTYQVKKPDAFITRFQGMLKTMNEAKIDSGLGADMALTYKASFTENALTVDGVKLHEYQIETVLPKGLLAQMGPMGGLMGMFTKQQGYIAVKGNQVIMTTGKDAKLMSALFASIDQTNGLGDEKMIKRVRATGLPENASMEAYVNLVPIVNMGNSMLMMFGKPQLPVPKDLPPIGIGGTAKDGTIVGKAYIPMPVIKFIKDSTMNAMMMMQGGGMGGNGDGHGDGPPPAPEFRSS